MEYGMLPKSSYTLPQVFAELKSLTNERYEGAENDQNASQEIRGLKFIANRLGRLFDKNHKLPYSEVTQILIKSFSSESQDQRNIKRRVYDAINVMVSAGHFQKKGESIERTENSLANVRTRGLRKSLDKRIAEREEEAEGKRRKINQLKKRIGKLKELVSRNRANLAKHSLRIYSPRIVVTGDFAPSLSKNGRTLTLLAAGGKSKGKRATNKDILILQQGEHAELL